MSCGENEELVNLYKEWDIWLLTVDDPNVVGSYCLELGGSVNIFARQMAKFGARTAVLSYVGFDPFGEFILQR
jgi:sugar/nucleoside kinase (ribokinase family)